MGDPGQDAPVVGLPVVPVQASEHAGVRPREVGLHRLAALLRDPRAAVGLGERAAVVPVRLQAEQQRAGDVELLGIHPRESYVGAAGHRAFGGLLAVLG